MDIISIINEKYQGMTKKQKQVAKYMSDHPDTMSFITLKELSAQTQVTELTILHTCQALGYESFNEVKYEFRKYLSIKNKVKIYQEQAYFNVDIPEYEFSHQELLLSDTLEEEKDMLDKYIDYLDIREISQVSELFHKYKKIIICGRGISYLLGEFLAIRLASCEIGAVLVNTELNDSVYGAFPLIDDKTLLVAISFPDYYYVTDQVIEYANKAGAKVLLITDPTGARNGESGIEILTAPSTTRMFLNTLSGPMVLINTLTSAIKVKKGKKRK